MKDKELKIIVFPLGPAIGSNHWHTYFCTVDFVHQHKGFSYRFVSHAYTIKTYLHDELSFKFHQYFARSRLVNSSAALTQLNNTLFSGGLMGKFINGDISEDEFFTSSLLLFGIDMPNEKAARDKIEKDFWHAFMAHNTYIPENTIRVFANTIANFHPAIPVAITRSTKPCMQTTKNKLSLSGVTLIESAQLDETTSDTNINLLCVNKKTHELTSAAEDAALLALESRINNNDAQSVSVHILGHFVRDAANLAARIKESTYAKFNCNTSVHFHPFNVKNGDTLATVGTQHGLLKTSEQTETKPCNYFYSSKQIKFGLFAVASGVLVAVSHELYRRANYSFGG